MLPGLTPISHTDPSRLEFSLPLEEFRYAHHPWSNPRYSKDPLQVILSHQMVPYPQAIFKLLRPSSLDYRAHHGLPNSILTYSGNLFKLPYFQHFQTRMVATVAKPHFTDRKTFCRNSVTFEVTKKGPCSEQLSIQIKTIYLQQCQKGRKLLFALYSVF